MLCSLQNNFSGIESNISIIISVLESFPSELRTVQTARHGRADTFLRHRDECRTMRTSIR